MSGTAPGFATFWEGTHLSAFEAACVSSYMRHGYEFTVFSYGPLENLPAGATLRSAADIAEERFKDAYRIKGVPSLSHFSDLFRYRLFERTPLIWVDSDMYLLRTIDIDLPKTLLAKEDATSLCGAIMRLDGESPALVTLLKQTEAIAGRDLEWGETGPRLLTSVFAGDVVAGAYGPKQFFPVHYDEFWKVLLPEYREECEALCQGSYTLHLWNNIVTKVGVWKDVLPPEGSFLQRRFVDDGMAHLFHGTFPVGPMRHVIDNYRMRLSGNLNDVVKMARMVVPGLKRRTIRQFDSMKQRLVPSR